MKLSATQIRSLIEKKEDERVEFKRATFELPDNLWETYSAFCNTDGRTIILGIREGKNKTYLVEGVSDAHNPIDDFWSAANNSEKVSYSIFFGHYVYPVKCGRKTVVVIEVPRAPRVTMPARKRLNHRGPLSIDMPSAWYFITICADGHAPWVGSRVPRDRNVFLNAIIFASKKFFQ